MLYMFLYVPLALVVLLAKSTPLPRAARAGPVAHWRELAAEERISRAGLGGGPSFH